MSDMPDSFVAWLGTTTFGAIIGFVSGVLLESHRHKLTLKEVVFKESIGTELKANREVADALQRLASKRAAFCFAVWEEINVNERKPKEETAKIVAELQITQDLLNGISNLLTLTASNRIHLHGTIAKKAEIFGESAYQDYMRIVYPNLHDIKRSLTDRTYDPIAEVDWAERGTQAEVDAEQILAEIRNRNTGDTDRSFERFSLSGSLLNRYDRLRKAIGRGKISG